MKKAANDNSETWIELAAATANLVRYLQKMDGSQESPAREPKPAKDEKEVANPEHGDAYIDAGLKRIRDFERRYRPRK
jgi:hypothetical protein